MNKAVVVIGSLAVLGVGVCFYLNQKKQDSEASVGSSTSGLPKANSSSQISVPPKGEVITTPEEVVKIAQKILDAKALALKINGLKTKREELALQPKVKGSSVFKSGAIESVVRDKKVKAINKQISDLEKLLTNLGYSEVSGKLIKIV